MGSLRSGGSLNCGQAALSAQNNQLSLNLNNSSVMAKKLIWISIMVICYKKEFKTSNGSKEKRKEKRSFLFSDKRSNRRIYLSG